ncbi:MAG: hypothetical protein ACREXU_11410 [Gammaproteobacteria bacterium]
MRMPADVNLSTLVLGLLCLIAGGLVAVELLPTPPPGPLPAETPAPASGKAPHGEGPNPDEDFNLPALSHYRVITERPLFVKSRQPASEGAATPDTPAQNEGQLSQYALTAIIIGPEQQFAILRAQAEGKLSRVTSGQEFQGWTLKQVEGDAVVFGRNDKEERMPLVRKTPDKIKQAARRAALLDRRRQQTQPQQPQQPSPQQPQGQQPQAQQPQAQAQPGTIPPPGEAPPPPTPPPEE